MSELSFMVFPEIVLLSQSCQSRIPCWLPLTVQPEIVVSRVVRRLIPAFPFETAVTPEAELDATPLK